jgi:ATP-dependent RNA helicase RhlE
MPFQALGLHPTLVRATREIHYVEPTPIQAQAIPAVLAGRDLLATAQTGTGKTAAFLLPILHRLLGQPRPKIQALILTPTRELALQIHSVLSGLARHIPLRSGVVLGGTAMGPQDKLLRAGAEIIIATTGRLLDHLRFNPSCLGSVHTLVLDEADRMLDMGFLPDIKRIITRLPARRQTLMFSATMPPVIAQLAREILRNPLTIEIGRHTTPVVGITQAAYPVREHLKTSLLRYLLRHTDMPSVLVFTRTRRSAKRLMKIIADDGFAVGQLHSDLSQSQRNRAMEGFRRGDFQILVATNIAARGLDVVHITHVINHDVPDVPEDYIHRIGRTARAGAEGDAWVLVSPQEERSLADIERQIGRRLPRVTLPDFDYAVAAPEFASHRHERSPDGRPSKPHRPVSHPPRKEFGHAASPSKGFGKPGHGKRRGGKKRYLRRP